MNSDVGETLADKGVLERGRGTHTPFNQIYIAPCDRLFRDKVI